MHVRRLALKAAVTPLMGVGLALVLLWVLSGQWAWVVADFAPNHVGRPERDALRTPGSVFTVCLDGGCDFDSVQAAVDAASEGDEIRVAAGTYTGVSARAGETQVVYINKSVTVRGGYTTTDWSTSNPISNPTTLDAEGQGRVLYIAAGISPTVEGLRITGGSAEGLGGGRDGQDVGGGVYVHGGAATISGCQVVSNAAALGGGIYVVGGRATLAANEVVGNSAERYDSVDARGGGVYLRGGDALILDNTFRANKADYGGGLYALEGKVSLISNRWVENRATMDGGGVGTSAATPYFSGNILEGNTAGEVGGGAVLYWSDATMDGSTFRENTARWGGGLWQSQGTLAFSGGVVISNTATNGGGGILVDSEGLAAVAESRLIANQAQVSAGGGLYLLRNSEAVLTNTIIADNQAAKHGNGLHVWASSARLVHTTLARNGRSTIPASTRLTRGDSTTTAEPQAASADLAGIYVRDGDVALIDTVFVGHEVGLYVDGGTAASLESTLWGGGTWVNGIDWSGPGTITHTNDYWGDPAFVDPDAGDFHIGPSSAAIDQGVDAGADHDIDGDPRPVPARGGFDLGADEYAEIDLSASRKRVHPSRAAASDVLTYTIILVNEGGLSSRDTLLVDAIPTQTTYITGSAMTSAGVLSDSGSIRWSGTLTPHQPVTITFSVMLGEASLVKNTAVVTDERGGVTTLWALVNGQRLWMPLILN
jgi:uncharacterized repeat protein (TIGR01451 family)